MERTSLLLHLRPGTVLLAEIFDSTFILDRRRNDDVGCAIRAGRRSVPEAQAKQQESPCVLLEL